MGTTKQEIGDWFDRGVRDGKTHMLVVCDTFDWEDYPVFVSADENPRAVYDLKHGPNMQKVMEVYNLGGDKATQLAEHRAMNF